jgi:hypothetical protein
MNILEAMGDPNLFGPWFEGESWGGWECVLRAAYALPMTDGQKAFFRTIAGERKPPARRVKELWIVAGRRAGKDSVASLIGAFTAALFDEMHRLRPGERPLVACYAVDREQAAIVLGYMRAMFADIPLLRALVARETQDGFALTNGVDLVVSTNSYRAARGRPVLVAIFDEVAYWRSELTSTPDLETYRAVKPGMATLSSTAMLVGISSPYRKSGLLYEKFKKHFGRDDDNVLVIKAPTAALNPSLDESVIAEALEDDPVAARADWLGEFRDDISGYADTALIEAAVDPGVALRPPRQEVAYTSFCDPSGGARDSFTCAVAHVEGDVAVLDNLVEVRAPFNPTLATQQVCGTLKAYRLHKTTGDKYAAEWVVDAFAKHGIVYEHSERDRSALYLDCLPLFTSGRARLLDNKRLVAQFGALERRTSPVGKDRIDHGPGGHDDLANSVAGALVQAVSNPGINWAAADGVIAAIARMRGRPGFAGVMPGDPDFPHRWNGRHLG